MSFCQIGDYQFRITPSAVVFPFDVDSTVITTVGGRVVQVYGVTLGDMVVQGLFGQERTGATRDSWQLAEDFQTKMAALVQKQSAAPSTGQLAGYDTTTMHPPHRFIYQDDTHDWDFMVYIKDLQDVQDNDYTVSHATGKFSYGYTLTLFIVEDNSRILRQVAVDKFISRLAAGVGWKRTEFNGPMDKTELENYVRQNSPDGTIHGLVLKQYQEASYFTGSGTGVIPGGTATVTQAQNALGGAATTPAAPTTPTTATGSVQAG
jgi:hypothetical protein